METLPLNFSAAEETAGFRLSRFELLNWGTFHARIWRIEPLGHNALLTGDIGSGKSTLVDALTTLLVPAHRINYNKAAGADTRERNLTSYVRGYYKTAKDEGHFAAKPVPLRADDSHSVLLGHFHNAGYQQDVTLAQVFWSKEGKSQPERFYVVADHPLTIAATFSGFGPQIADLRKRLRKEPGVLIFDSFAQYAAEFRRRMSIENDQALELFYQTVSMKSVGNLTDFVRSHMLAETPVDERVREICRNFDNLNRAHEAVLKAKRQIELLTPLIMDCDRYDEIMRGIEGLRHCRETLTAYFAAQKTELLAQRIERTEAELAKLTDRLSHDREQIALMRHQIQEIRQSIAEQGGRRLEDLALEIQRLEVERGKRAARSEEYGRLCDTLDLPAVTEVDRFHANRHDAETLRARLETDREKTHSRLVDIQIALKASQEELARLDEELASLRQRESSIPLQSLEIRQRLCETLGIDEAQLPFAGELLQIRADELEWEGALERLLRNFGLSLLVPDSVYGAIARYVDATHLKSRLVYFRVRVEKRLSSEEISDSRTVIRKLDIKPNSDFQEWLEQELARHFNYVCCETLEEFQRETRALSRQGQAKSQGRRHEKDDRFHLEDRTRYILGWTNEGKIQALEAQRERRLAEIAKAEEERIRLARRLRELEESRDQARDLVRFQEFHEIDWASVASDLENIQEERRALLDGSDVLRKLQASLAKTEEQLAQTDEAFRARDNDRAIREERLQETRRQLEEARQEAGRLSHEDRQNIIPELETMQPQALGDRKLTVENCDKSQTDMREWLQNRLDAQEKMIARLLERIVQQMQAYKTAYPLETREADANIAAAGEYRDVLQRLRQEDLPRHEETFRRLLNEGTINDIALFQNQLDKEQSEISDRIARINVSLREIEYDAGTYIELVSDHALDMEVRQFQQDLRACLGDTLTATEEDLYNERKFLQVKALIDRFNGREGYTEIDQRWTQKVADVRNWSEFSVCERWRETDEMKEFYSDSAGKSGGQKEKLAYTILASALAYQYGLERGTGRTFRFTMIDEAFGRGSDGAARYGLELFKKLNLQLLIVTPLQKIHVIEDYVQSVHFVHNKDGRESKMRNLSIEAYRAEKEQFLQRLAPTPPAP